MNEIAAHTSLYIVNIPYRQYKIDCKYYIWVNHI